MKIYETERLVLKTLDKTYANAVLEYYVRNREFLREWEPVRQEEFFTREHQEKLLHEDWISMGRRSLLRLWIYKKEDKDRIIGTIGFANIVRGAFLSCHLGYKLDKDEINKGYMTEAIRKGIDIIFNEMGLHRIEANIMPRNLRSLRVAENLGFRSEGMAYQYLKINGKWEDHIHMVLLNEKA